MIFQYSILAPDGARHTATGDSEFNRVIADLQKTFGDAELCIRADVIENDARYSAVAAKQPLEIHGAAK